MKFKIPLFPEPFELFHPEGEVSSLQLEVLNQIESHLTEDLMKDVIEQMHKFYTEGQKHVSETLPKMIELGAMTQEQFDELQKDCPSTESSEDFVDFYCLLLAYVCLTQINAVKELSD